MLTQQPIKVNLILAVDESGVMGLVKPNPETGSYLPWSSIPEDFASFKVKTADKIVVMGRKTWDSLPTKFKPLPGRTMNIVMTKGDNPESNKKIMSEGGAVCVDMGALYATCAGRNIFDVWVIGGKEICELFLKTGGNSGFEIASIHRTLVNGHRAENSNAVMLGQENRQKFVRMPAMVDPIKGYPHLGFVCTNLQTFHWGKIEVFSPLS